MKHLIKKIIIIPLVSLLFLITVAFLAVAVWSKISPIPLSFLKPMVEKQLGQSEGVLSKVDFDGLFLRWTNFEYNFEIFAKNLSANHENQQRCLSIPEVGINFSFQSLLEKQIAITRLSITGTEIVAENKKEEWHFYCQDKNNSLTLSDFNQNSSQNSSSDVVSFKKLDGFSLKETNLTYLEEGKSVFSINNISIESQTLKAEDHQTIEKINVKAISRRSDFNFSGVVVEGADFDINTTINIKSGDVDLNRMEISLSNGIMIEDFEKHIIPIDFFETEGSLNFYSLSGSLKKTHLYLSKGEIRKSFFGADLPLNYISFDVKFDAKKIYAQVENGLLGIGSRQGHFEASLLKEKKEVDLKISSTLNEIYTDDIYQLWPKKLSDDPRNWIMYNILKGYIPKIEANFEAKFTPDFSKIYSEKLDVKAPLQNITLRFMETMPLVQNIQADLKLDLNGIDFDVKSAEIEGIKLNAGKVSIGNFNDKMVYLKLDADIEGDLTKHLEIINRKPFEYLKKAKVDPQTIKGYAYSKFRLKLPLKDDLKDEDVIFSVNSRLKNASYTEMPYQLDVAKGNLQLNIDRNRLLLSGKSLLGGKQAKWTWLENFRDKSKFVRQYTVERNFNVSFLKRLGVNLSDYARKGSAYVYLSYRDHRNKKFSVDVSANLKNTQIDIPQLNWSKPIGKQAKGRVNLLFSNKKIEKIVGAEIKTSEFHFMGDCDCRFQNNVFSYSRVYFHKFSYKNFDLSGTLQKLNKGYKVDLEANHFDARPFINNKQKEQFSFAEPLIITANIKSLRLSEHLKISRAKISSYFDGKEIDNLKLSGTAGRGGINFLLKKQSPQTSRLSLNASDAGSLAGVMKITDGMVGGRLSFNGKMNNQTKAINGHLQVKRFSMRNPPFLTKLLSVASITGIFDVLSGQGLNFDILKTDLNYQNERITLSKGSISGSSLGLTFRGHIDLKNDRMNLSGAVVPFFLMNKVLGSIPLLGDLLVGRENEGIIATNYRAKGKLSDPEISVNPLSTFTPGFLRNIFGD